MQLYDHRIPNSDIWLAARLALQVHGAEAPVVIGRAISDMEDQGKTEQVRAWRTVSLALDELMAAGPAAGSGPPNSALN